MTSEGIKKPNGAAYNLGAGPEPLQKDKVQSDTWTQTAVKETDNTPALENQQGQQRENNVSSLISNLNVGKIIKPDEHGKAT